MSTPTLARSNTVDFVEELHLALAISASEAELARLKALEGQVQADADFALALQLQQQEQEEGSDEKLVAQGKSTPPTPPSPPSPSQPPRIPRMPQMPQKSTRSLPKIREQVDQSKVQPHMCAGCGKHRGANYMKAMEKSWHPQCFKCHGCGQPVHGVFVTREGNPFHRECHTTLFHEKCTVCQLYLPSSGGRISWSEHSFWREKFCSKHNVDGTPGCTGCERLKAHGASWIKLDDGRQLCTDCQGSIVVDTKDCQPLYDEIQKDYAALGMKLPEKTPLSLVDADALNDYSAKERSYGGHGVSQTRGMTLTEEYTKVQRVVRRGTSGWRVFPEILPVESRHCTVTAILVLYGLPRLVVGSIIAHEMMHAWLKLNQISGLTPKVEEGICQLMALIWLEKQTPADPYEQRLVSFAAHQIRTHPSPVYGDGFRAAHKAMQEYGLQSVVDHIRHTGELPVPSLETPFVS